MLCYITSNQVNSLRNVLSYMYIEKKIYENILKLIRKVRTY